MKKKTRWRLTAIAVLALVPLQVSGEGSSLTQASASYPGSFCRISDADALLKRQGGRTRAGTLELIADRKEVKPGMLVRARLANATQSVVLYGSEFEIQRHDAHAGWRTDPSSPDGPWLQSAGELLPGRAEGCYRFTVPAAQDPGRYRFLVSVELGSTRKKVSAPFVIRDWSAVPKFADVLRFREEHGLDLDLDPIEDEPALRDRVLGTISDWVERDPVARASWARWGVPLRAPEAAELDWRLTYWRQASAAIPGWVNANSPDSFAGFYIDESAGGLITVGFTGDQAGWIDSLLVGAGLLVSSDRVRGMIPTPIHSLRALEELQKAIGRTIRPLAISVRIGIDLKSNLVLVRTQDVDHVEAALGSEFGPDAPIDVVYGRPLEPKIRK